MEDKKWEEKNPQAQETLEKRVRMVENYVNNDEEGDQTYLF